MQNEYGDWINSAGIERCCLQNGAGMNSTLNQSEFVFTKKLFQLITKLANKLRDEVNGLIEMHKLASSRASANNAVKSLENRNDWENWVNSCVNNFFYRKINYELLGKRTSHVRASMQMFKNVISTLESIRKSELLALCSKHSQISFPWRWICSSNEKRLSRNSRKLSNAFDFIALQRHKEFHKFLNSTRKIRR